LALRSYGKNAQVLGVAAPERQRCGGGLSKRGEVQKPPKNSRRIVQKEVKARLGESKLDVVRQKE